METQSQGGYFSFSFGTTITVVMNDAGSYIFYDCKATTTLSPEEASSYAESGKQVPYHEKANKAVQVGKQLYVTIGGNKAWAHPIIDSLKEEVENLTLQKSVQKALERLTDTQYVHPSTAQNGIDIQTQPSSMTFSSYNQPGEDLKTTYVRRNVKGKTTWAHVIKKSEEEGYVKAIGETDPLITFCCHGSGAKFARHILNGRREFIDSGTDKEIHADEILKSMAWACKKDPDHTAGLVTLILLTKDGVEHLYKKDAKVLLESNKEWLAAMEKQEREARLAQKNRTAESGIDE